MASIGVKTCAAAAMQGSSRAEIISSRNGWPIRDVVFTPMPEEEHRMYLKPIIVVSALAFATSSFAQGVSSNTPGHKMQKSTTQKTTVHKSTKSVGPGASAYSPGHKMHRATKSSGASEYTPSHTTTGSATRQSTTGS